MNHNLTKEELFKLPLIQRMVMANNNKYLELFLYDEEPQVKKILIRKEYGLDVLCNDKNETIRNLALNKINEKK